MVTKLLLQVKGWNPEDQLELFRPIEDRTTFPPSLNVPLQISVCRYYSMGDKLLKNKPDRSVFPLKESLLT